MTDIPLHHDCDGGFCVACAQEEERAYAPCKVPCHLRECEIDCVRNPRKGTGQEIYVIKRHGKYLTKKGGWTGDITRAAGWPQNQARTKARIDVGMRCHLVRVTFVAASNAEVIDVG